MPLFETVFQEKPAIVLEIGSVYTKWGQNTRCFDFIFNFSFTDLDFLVKLILVSFYQLKSSQSKMSSRRQTILSTIKPQLSSRNYFSSNFPIMTHHPASVNNFSMSTDIFLWAQKIEKFRLSSQCWHQLSFVNASQKFFSSTLKFPRSFSFLRTSSQLQHSLLTHAW